MTISEKLVLLARKFAELKTSIQEEISSLRQEVSTVQTIVGPAGESGRNGKDGRDGKDGSDGRNGVDGTDGKDGVDGKDGISVVDAKVDFDGSLVMTLSDGNEIDAGKVVSESIAKEFNSFMTRGEILPLQDGNAGKYLKTDGNTLSWDTLDGSDINLASPPVIGNTTPNAGTFTTLTGNSTSQFGRSSANYVQVTGNSANNSPEISALGSDTNIDLALTPKGTGNVRFGTYTASLGLVIAGYIEVKDAGGTLRRLAVVS